MDPIQIVRDGKAWAIKHKGSYLGFVSTHSEATRIACELAAYTMQQAPFAPAQLSIAAGPSVVQAASDAA